MQLDVRDAEAVAQAVDGHDAVIHTAYVQEDIGVIVDGTAFVAAACAAAGARLVHVSTDVVFDGALGRPYREDDEPEPDHRLRPRQAGRRARRGGSAAPARRSCARR